MMILRRRSVLLVVAVLLAVAVGIGLVITEFGTAQEEPVRPVGSLLGTSNRSVLSVCIDTVGTAALSGQEVARVQQAVTALRAELADRSYQESVLGLLDGAVVARGCPPPAAQNDWSRSVNPKTGKPSVLGPAVTRPSQHVLHIYIVPDATFREWFEDQPYGTGGEEMMCAGHQCWGVTSGLYLTPSASGDVLYQALRRILGFVDPFEELGPTPTPLAPGTIP